MVGGTWGEAWGAWAGGFITLPERCPRPRSSRPPCRRPPTPHPPTHRFETTAHSLGWAMYEVARCPEVQGKLESELAGAGLLGSTARALQFADLTRLTYLNYVLKARASVCACRGARASACACGTRASSTRPLPSPPLSSHTPPAPHPRPPARSRRRPCACTLSPRWAACARPRGPLRWARCACQRARSSGCP